MAAAASGRPQQSILIMFLAGQAAEQHSRIPRRRSRVRSIVPQAIDRPCIVIRIGRAGATSWQAQCSPSREQAKNTLQFIRSTWYTTGRIIFKLKEKE